MAAGLLLDHVDILLNNDVWPRGSADVLCKQRDHDELEQPEWWKSYTWRIWQPSPAQAGGGFQVQFGSVSQRLTVSYSYRLTFQKDLQCNKVSAVTTVQTWILWVQRGKRYIILSCPSPSIAVQYDCRCKSNIYVQVLDVLGAARRCRVFLIVLVRLCLRSRLWHCSCNCLTV